jgi:hypothetical protein
LLVWISIFLLLYMMMACMCSLLRKQWVERERYVFPLVQLPVDMAQSPEKGHLLNAFMRNQKMWIGFSIPVFIHGLNGFHSFYPSFPQIKLYFSLWNILNEKPWDSMNPIDMNIYLSVIGFSYLLALEVSLSIWFFFLFYKIQSVLLSIFGVSLPSVTGFGFAKEFSAFQEMGACLVFVGFLLWIMKDNIKKALITTFTKKSHDDPKEALSYKLSVWGWIISVIGLCLILNLAGMSVNIALAIILLYAVVCIILTWQVSNAGMLLVNPSFAPDNLIEAVLGSSRIRVADLTIIALMPRNLMRDQREFMMPNIMHTLKISDSANLKRGYLLFFMFLVIVIAIPFATYFSVRLNYLHPNIKSYEFWEQKNPFYHLTYLMQNPTHTNWNQITFMTIGSVLMTVLVLMRMTFLWWPVHPVGYAMFSSWATLVLWFSFFLGWLMKFLIVKYGGARAYGNARPFFLGLVLGESIMCGFWNLIGFITGHGYRIMPG